MDDEVDELTYANDQAEYEAVDMSDEDDATEVLGEPGVELEHPYPDNALVEARLPERFGIHLGPISPGQVAGLFLRVQWPGRQPPRVRKGLASEFVVSEREFALIDQAGQRPPLFEGIGRAEFAVANVLPDGTTGRMEFPWDPWGVAMELAEFDALLQVEHWAGRNLTAARG